MFLRQPYGTSTLSNQYAIAGNPTDINNLSLTLYNYNGIHKDIVRANKDGKTYYHTQEFSESMDLGQLRYIIVTKANYLRAKLSSKINNWEQFIPLDEIKPFTHKQKKEKGAYIYNKCKRLIQDEWDAMKDEYFLPQPKNYYNDVALSENFDDVPPEISWDEKKENNNKPLTKDKRNTKIKIMKNEEKIENIPIVIKNKRGRKIKHHLKKIILNADTNQLVGKGRPKLGSRIKIVWVLRDFKTKNYVYGSIPAEKEEIITVEKKNKEVLV